MLIKDVFMQSREIYGVRRIKESLVQRYGLVFSKSRIEKIMRFLNLKTKRRRKFKVTTTNSNHNFTISPNRIKRDFYSSMPNDKYVGDKNINKNILNICFFNVKYIQTKQETMYLATVIDLYSKKLFDGQWMTQ
ncbi:MAG: hypothetical protein COA66_10390 [Arcobacter sp.]|nr:MAG: hypothetical protein COA66_10390 [Arcobacter sp.]